MKNPWIINKSFDVMFCDTVDVSGTRDGKKFRSSVPCCLFPIESIDTFIDSDTDTALKQINVIIKICDFKRCCDTKPKLGDSIMTIDGIKWKVADVEVEQYWYKIIARSNI